MHNILRKAGEALRGMDENYAARVRKDSGSLPLTQMLGGQALGIPKASTGSELAMQFAKEGSGPASKGMVQRHQAAELAMGAGILATNVGYRYGIPAAGTAVALKGAIDMAGVLGQQTSATLEP